MTYRVGQSAKAMHLVQQAVQIPFTTRQCLHAWTQVYGRLEAFKQNVLAQKRHDTAASGRAPRARCPKAAIQLTFMKTAHWYRGKSPQASLHTCTRIKCLLSHIFLLYHTADIVADGACFCIWREIESAAAAATYADSLMYIRHVPCLSPVAGYSAVLPRESSPTQVW